MRETWCKDCFDKTEGQERNEVSSRRIFLSIRGSKELRVKNEELRIVWCDQGMGKTVGQSRLGGDALASPQGSIATVSRLRQPATCAA